MKNKHGLARRIPAEVRRLVRQRCGFGCVICGASIIEYEHVDPTFAEAKEHDPQKIGLLCPRCHSKVTRGFLAKQSVKEAMENPICKQRGYASEILDVGKLIPQLYLAALPCRTA